MNILEALKKAINDGEPFKEFPDACKIVETPLKTTIIYPGGCGGFVNIEYYEKLDILIIDPTRHWGEEKIIINASKTKKAHLYHPRNGHITKIDTLTKNIIKEFFELLEVGGV